MKKREQSAEISLLLTVPSTHPVPPVLCLTSLTSSSVSQVADLVNLAPWQGIYFIILDAMSATVSHCEKL